jgi:hypothetical protein
MESYTIAKWMRMGYPCMTFATSQNLDLMLRHSAPTKPCVPLGHSLRYPIFFRTTFVDFQVGNARSGRLALSSRGYRMGSRSFDRMGFRAVPALRLAALS